MLARTGLDGLGLAGCAGSRWSSWTRSGMHREPRIMSQLAGLEDMDKVMTMCAK